MQPRDDLFDQLLIRRRRTFEDRAGSHVHVGGVSLEMKERAVEPAQPVRSGHVAHQVAGAPQEIRVGDAVTVSGSTSATDTGQQLVLAYQQPGPQWRAIAYPNVQGDGSFRFVTRLRRSGQLTVLTAGGSTTVAAVATTNSAQSAETSGVNGTPLAGTT